MFKERGYDIVDFTEEADVYVINTCTVTHLADRKSRQLIRRCRKTNPQARVVVAGCYSQVSPLEVERLPGVSLVIGTAGKKRIVDLLEETSGQEGPVIRVQELAQDSCFEEMDTCNIINRARAYLKIQEGCEQFCTYCIIPYARGPVRSRPPENALSEAERLIANGFREIVLTGIHLGHYGRDLSGGINLEMLLARLLALDSNVRWRLSSLEPTEVSNELLALLDRHANFCPHLHLPLQSAHNEILRAMNRPYTTQEYRDMIKKVRRQIPDIALTTDVIVGFPGETDTHFQAYLSFIEEISFSGLHIFKYSPRRNTPAARFPCQVSPVVKEERSRKLQDLADKLAHRYSLAQKGKTLGVLAETYSPEGVWEGHSENYLMVRFRAEGIRRGEIVPVKVREVRGKTCFGQVYSH